MTMLAITRALPVDPVAITGGGVELVVFPHDRPPTPGELVALARGADGLVTLLSDRIDGAFLDACPSVRVIANVAVGFDNVDVAAARARGVVVTNTPDVLTDATAELTLALILATARRLGEAERLLRRGDFHHWSPTMLLGMGLSGKTLGIVGLGRIGRAVARLGAAIGMRPIATTRTAPREPSVPCVPLPELLATADVVSVHAPASPETRHLIGAPELAAMKRGALLVNTARGTLVDEAALVRALESGHLGGAGLDVFEEEPRVHPGLLSREDVVLLPHIGSATREARAAMATLALRGAVAVLEGREPLHRVG